MALDITVDGDKVTVTFNLSDDEGLSASRKTRLIATSHGNQEIGKTGAFIGLNVYRKV